MSETHATSTDASATTDEHPEPRQREFYLPATLVPDRLGRLLGRLLRDRSRLVRSATAPPPARQFGMPATPPATPRR